MATRKVARLESRSYQRRALRALPGLLRKYRRVVAVSPTGSGKTVIGAALIRLLKGKRILWLAHRIELLRQARTALIAAGIPAADIGILTGQEKENETARVLVASVGMFSGKRRPPQVDLIVVDEAHRVMAKSYRAIIGKTTPVLGLTATPWRLDGQGIGDVFAHLYLVAEPLELMADGFIAKPIVYGVPKEKARAILRGVGSNRREYDREKLGRAMSKRTLLGDCVTESARLAPGAATLVFAVNRQHARALAQRFLRSGRPTAYLDGDTPSEERDELLSKTGPFATGKIEVIVNVEVLSEGYDCPAAKCIVLARPTRSLTRYLQYIGRGSRVFGNKRLIVLDHGGNAWRFGFPDAKRDWDLADREQPGTGDAPIRHCEDCGALAPISATCCPECGSKFTLSAIELSEELANLEKLRATKSENDRRRSEALRYAKLHRWPRRKTEEFLALLEVA